MIKKNILEIEEIFSKLTSYWPNAHCELKYNNPFQCLIAVVLSARATDKSVNKALSPLLEENPKFAPEDLIKIGEEDFLKKIRQVGLAPTKARNCVSIAKRILQDFQGKIPIDRDILESFPGVGRKVANVFLNVIGGLPTMPVDTHVERVSKRLGLVPPSFSPKKIEEELLKIIPEKYLAKAHHVLIFHGRYHCTSRSPKCQTCPVENLCLKQKLN